MEGAADVSSAGMIDLLRFEFGYTD